MVYKDETCIKPMFLFARLGEVLDKMQSKLEHKKVYANGIKKDCECK